MPRSRACANGFLRSHRAWVVATAAAIGCAIPAAASTALDGGTCSALRQAASAKFSLGLAACGLADDAPQASTLPRDRQAQQLQLYDAPPPAPTADRHPASDVAPAAPTTPRPADRRVPVSLQRALRLAPVVDDIALVQDIDPLLLHAVAHVESRHDARAVSHAGARGVMQVMPTTAARYGVREAAALHDATTNLEVGARHLRSLLQRYAGDVTLALAAYNAGEGAVDRHGRRVPPYRETRAYVVQVLQEYRRLQAAAARPAVAAR